MKVIGKEYLDEGTYDLITIKDDEIIISNSGSLKRNQKDNLFENRSDNEIINYVVNSFLWNNTVRYISNEEASTIDNKKIKFDKDYVYLKIKNKYEYDRLYHLYHTESDRVDIISSNKKSYYNSVENKYCLKKNDDKLIYEELMFLNNMIDYMFQNQVCCLAFIYNEMIIMSIDQTKKIKLGNSIKENNLSIICELVSNHNKMIFNNKNSKKLIREMK